MTRDESFDAVARLLAGHGSRRTLLQLLGAGIGSAWASTPRPVTAAPKPRCRKLAKTCSKRKKCCKGTKCVRGRCACPKTKKPCGKICIAPTACCPATEDRCQGECVPKGTCCTAQQKRCGNRCILRTACCTNDDCTGPCETGACRPNNQCELKAAESPCETDVIGHCDESGICIAAACSDDLPCREPAHPCRYAECTDNLCIAKPHANGHVLPEQYQTQWDCIERICENVPGGIADSPDDEDFPPHPGPCTESLCGFQGPQTQPRPEGYDCGLGQVCDGNHNCVPRS